MSRWEWVIVKKKILIYVDNLLFLSSYIGVLAIVVFLLQIITIASFRIPTDSMQPTLQPGDNILVNKNIMGARIFDIWEVAEEKEVEIYRLPGLGKVKRNDVLVFHYPYPHKNDSLSMHLLKYYVKRCIALVSQGYITGELKTGFPTENIADPDNFVSLLYYFGMLTIDGTIEGETKFIIPNQVIREQLFKYLLDTYNDADLSYSSYDKSKLDSRLAYRGEWKEYFQYIADCLSTYASQRDKMKGEYFVHGFTLAMTAQNRFYRPESEKDTQGGYVDIFLLPMTGIWKDMKHSYIIEMQYARNKDNDEVVARLREEAIAQANRYADTEVVRRNVGMTALHKIVVVYRGMEMVVCEEV